MAKSEIEFEQQREGDHRRRQSTTTHATVGGN
jgi:hypothetical protein